MQVFLEKRLYFMDKKQLAERCGVFVNGQWQVKNLKFLAEFMNQTDLTTGDIAKGVGLLRNSVTRWFMVDDTALSRVINRCGLLRL